MRFTLITIFLLLISSISYSNQQNSSLMTKILNAYGGKNKLNEISTIYAHGSIDDFLRKKSGGYARTMKRPGILRIDIMPEQGGEVRILNGDKGWQGSGNQLRLAKPISLSSMNYQYAYLDLPMSLADESARVLSEKDSLLYGKPMKLLTIHTESSPILTVYIDPETYLIKRVQAEFSMGSMGSMQLGTEYENFKNVDGIMFPFTLNNFAGGKISVITLKNIRLNQELPESVFSPNQ